MGNCYSLYSKNLGMSGKMVWWSTEPNWSTKLGDLLECLKLTLEECSSFGIHKMAFNNRIGFVRPTSTGLGPQ